MPKAENVPLAVYWVNQYAVPPDQPGGTRHFDMASELRRRGIDVKVVASDLTLVTRTYGRRRRWWSLRAIDEDVAGVPFTWLSAGSYSANNWRRVASMAVFAFGVFAHMLRVPVRRGRTVFIGSSPHLFAAAAAHAAARLRRLPFVFEVRDLWPESYVEMTGRKGGPEVWVMRLIADRLYRASAAVVVLAPANSDHVIARGARAATVHVVPNGVDLKQFAVNIDTPVMLGRPDRFTFVYAGAHGPANGLDIVLDACRLLEGRGDTVVHVALLGDGPAKARLVARAKALSLANLTFHDPVAKDDVPAVLRTADAGLMILAPAALFAYGVSPNKLFDYLASDLPVVANVPGWVARIVEQSGAGLVVPPGDANALADAMVALVKAQGDPCNAMPSGRGYVAEHFERRALAGRLAAVLDIVASGIK